MGSVNKLWGKSTWFDELFDTEELIGIVITGWCTFVYII